MLVTRAKKKLIIFLTLLLGFFACNKDDERVFIEVQSFEGDITINSQEDLNAFSKSNYDVITGDLKIRGNVSSIEGLIGLNKVLGDMSISDTQLQSLEGLNNLNEVGGTITILNNENLLDFCALQFLFTSGVDNSVFIDGNSFDPTPLGISLGTCKMP